MKSFNDYLKEAALSAKQKKIAKIAGDKDKIDAHDLAALRSGKKPVEEAKKCMDEARPSRADKVTKDLTSIADKKGYKSAKDFTRQDWDKVAKPHGYTGKEIAAVRGHKVEEVELEEGRMKDLAYDLDNMSHDEFHKQYGHPKHHYDPTNFKKPVEPGKGMDRARALAQRGMQSLSKEEVERIEEKLTQIDELSKKTLGSYVKRSANQAIIKSLANPKDDSDDMKTIAKREKGINLATSKLAKEEVEQETSAYLKATLAVMDEGKIDNLRDAQKLRRDTQSAYEKDYKPDTSHPHIQVVKGSAYGGANQKDDEGDEKPDETKEKKGRGRPAGSKSGARQKGGGHEDGGIPVHNLNLPKSYK